MSKQPVVQGTYVKGPPQADLPVARAASPVVATTLGEIPETDAELARRLQDEEYDGAHPRPPEARVAVVQSRYFGPTSCLASALLFCVFPPCAIVPCIAPCDGAATAVVYAGAPPMSRRRRRRVARHAVVIVPAHLRAGDVIQTTTADGAAVSVRVPPRVGPGDSIAIEY